MKKLKTLFLLLIISSAAAGQYKIERYVSGSGGNPVSNSNFKVAGTAGQLLTGQSTAEHFGAKSGFWYTYSILTSVKENESIPDEYTLFNNYPNPFNPSTMIVYHLPSASDVKLIIYDILGEEIEVLVNAEMQPGKYEVAWNASRYTSGVYFCHLRAVSKDRKAEEFIQTKKMILLK